MPSLCQESNELHQNKRLLQRRQETQLFAERVRQMLRQGQKVQVKVEMLLEQVQKWSLQVVLIYFYSKRKLDNDGQRTKTEMYLSMVHVLQHAACVYNSRRSLAEKLLCVIS